MVAERLRWAQGKTFPGATYDVIEFSNGGLCHNGRTGEAVLYSMLHFIAYYPALVQLAFIFSVKQSCKALWGPF